MPYSEHAIAVAEAAYDLGASAEDWFSQVLDAALPLFDRGLGFAGVVARKPPTLAPFEIFESRVVTGRPDFPDRHTKAYAHFPPQQIYDQTQPGMWLLSEWMAGKPWEMEIWQRHVDYAQDAFGLIALDPDGYGVQLLAPVSEVNPVTQAERDGWNMLAAHLSSGLRVRRMAAKLHRAEAPNGDGPPDGDGFPYGAEAVIDPSKADVVDATGGARAADALQALRDGAIRVDRARGRLRRDNPKEALEMWEPLMRERWSLVDWFDSDDRRYLLAVPNAPDVEDPRNLTPRERQVVAHAVMGESHKIIAYRLGVSRPTVTNALRSAMRKLGVTTQAELVARWRPLVERPVASRDGR